MDLESLRAYCLAKQGATEGFPFGEEVLVFKAKKMFALVGLTNYPLTINLKCDPERAEELRAQYPGITPGYHMDKKHWNTLQLDDTLSPSFVRELIDHSYDLVVASLTKKEREALLSH